MQKVRLARGYVLEFVAGGWVQPDEANTQLESNFQVHEAKARS
jgi:hypothetical protein